MKIRFHETCFLKSSLPETKIYLGILCHYLLNMETLREPTDND